MVRCGSFRFLLPRSSPYNSLWGGESERERDSHPFTHTCLLNLSRTLSTRINLNEVSFLHPLSHTTGARGTWSRLPHCHPHPLMVICGSLRFLLPRSAPYSKFWWGEERER